VAVGGARRLLLQCRQHGVNVPFRERLRRLPLPVRARPGSLSNGQRGGRCSAPTVIRTPTRRRPGSAAAWPTPMSTGMPGGCSRRRKTADRYRSTPTPWTPSASGPGTATWRARPPRRTRRSIRAPASWCYSGSPRRARPPGHRLLRGRPQRADHPRGLVRGALFEHDPRLGRHRALRHVPGHPADQRG